MTEIHDTPARELGSIPGRWAHPPAKLISKLPRYTGRRDTPPAQREKRMCTECGTWHAFPAVHLDYMGHADVTLALIDVDPCWTWEPAAFDELGAPAIRQLEGRLVMWGWLTVHGVRRLAVGTCETGKSDPEKELIGDLLRNGAMRFGIGTGLWSKSEGDDATSPAPDPLDPATIRASTEDPDLVIERTKVGGNARRGPQKAAQATEPPPPPPEDPETPRRRSEPTEKMLGLYRRLCREHGIERDDAAEHDFDLCRAEIDRLIALPKP
jgi:hypothetical protein